jgi:hypothetical protein
LATKKSEEEAEAKAGLLGMRAKFNVLEREKILEQGKLIKAQEKEIALLNRTIERREFLDKVETPKPIRVAASKGKKPKAFQLHLSDTHSTEIVTRAHTDGRNQHDCTIGRERLRSVIMQSITLMNDESRHCIPSHLTVWLGGDFNVNADLHYKMERSTDFEPLDEMAYVYKMLSEELHLLFSKTPTVSCSVVGSFSNHGRDSEKMLPGLEASRSYDTHVYRRLEGDFPEVRFTVAETPWTVEEVGGFKTLYTHGHVIGSSAKRSASNIMVPNWAFIQKLRENYDFDAWVQGHQHTVCVLKSSKFAHMQNGSLVGENSYSTSNGYPGEPPAQNLAVIDIQSGMVEKVHTIVA